MLTRETAIEAIEKFITRKGTFVYNFSFPFSFIPKDLEMGNWLFQSSLDANKDSLSYDILQIIYNHLLSSNILNIEKNYIEFINTNHHISLLEIIDSLDRLQKEFNDLEKQDDIELNELIDISNKIKNYEYKLIDEAEILFNIEKDIESCLLEWKEKINNKNYWIGG